jgi:segregation and condensation protein B
LRSSFQNLIKDLIPAELGTGALRTLAAIAIKSPILQTDVIELRGSSAYEQIKELVELGFIRKRRQSDGRSYWLEVTDKFHQYFEVDKLSIS